MLKCVSERISFFYLNGRLTVASGLVQILRYFLDRTDFNIRE